MAYVVEANEHTFEKEVERCELPVLVEFLAPWCRPCQTVAPTLHSIAHEYAGKAKVVSVDAEKHAGLAGRFKVANLPTVILFLGGQAKATLIGIRSKEEYLRHLHSLFAAQAPLMSV